MLFHKYKLIFTGIPKNASTSIFNALKNLTDNSFNHQILMDDYRYNDSELMETYPNLAIVRNPYDRFVSACYQIRKDDEGKYSYLTLNEITDMFVINGEDNFGFVNVVFYPQHKFICFGRKILADYILKYETLEKDWEEFATTYNKTSQFHLPTKIPRHNVSENKKSWKDEIKGLSSENLEYINKKYKLDFELFNYKIING